MSTFHGNLSTGPILQKGPNATHVLSSCLVDSKQVVYMCIYFYSMQHKIALPGWCHECNLKTLRVSHLGQIFRREDGYLGYYAVQNFGPKWLTLNIFNCTHDVIQVELFCAACCKNKYTFIWLSNNKTMQIKNNLGVPPFMLMHFPSWSWKSLWTCPFSKLLISCTSCCNIHNQPKTKRIPPTSTFLHAGLSVPPISH